MSSLSIPRQFDHHTPNSLHPTVASWPFDAWGLDVVGPMTKSSGGHLYILAATYYFSKWAEAVLLKEVKKENVVDFIRTNIIYRYGVPSLLKKVMAKSKRDWHERIGEALWAYRTIVRTPTQSTPYALVYGVETVLPLEQQIPSLRIAIQEGLTKEEKCPSTAGRIGSSRRKEIGSTTKARVLPSSIV
ncbi:UNVERIFIED_CONTAM: hypothetical protein Slati_2131200 [Sesamum latifolium]|uniref:Uncharacterized protein n=1 Tax=Sesamum latifolium TaxID=2727402 RepID=A0AAW2WQT5_9LAMI